MINFIINAQNLEFKMYFEGNSINIEQVNFLNRNYLKVLKEYNNFNNINLYDFLQNKNIKMYFYKDKSNKKNKIWV
ncbi:MAG: hypothetical protein PWP46_1781 [Fusobacteriaceae bacterium]|nr:hypothetical protein [Fusobacteriales bacterium]MDN5304895.1 hypothetical protein [Fusobacteriaceae bacterium]